MARDIGMKVLALRARGGALGVGLERGGAQAVGLEGGGAQDQVCLFVCLFLFVCFFLFLFFC